MKERGIDLIYGRWLIEGAPRVILIDTRTGYKYLNEWKGDLWNAAGIPSPDADHETNEAIVFGYLVAWFLGEVRLFFFLLLNHSWMLLTSRFSSLPMNDAVRSSPISMNGWQELRCP